MSTETMSRMPRRIPTLRALLARWHAAYGDVWMTTRELVMNSTGRSDGLPALIEEVTGSPLRDRSTVMSLSQCLSTLAMGEWKVDGWEVEAQHSGDGRNVRQWRVFPIEREQAPRATASASEDDLLRKVLADAMYERTITGTQADRLLSLWHQKG
jgi:hypothetical protein